MDDTRDPARRTGEDVPTDATRGHVPDVVRSVGQLRAAAQLCRGCALYAGATQAVMGDGPEDARLVLVGEQPGDQEDRVGEPFVGPAGRLLERAMGEAGIDPARVYLTNAVKHFRHEGNRGTRRLHRSPGRTHVVACAPWLDAELRLVRPTGVVLLGATAGGAVHGPSCRLAGQRGRPVPWPADRWPLEHVPAWTLATMHPSGVLRSRDREADLAALVADLATARRLVDRPRGHGG
ncbi:MAG: UdgX family uracil-DNA binding protein [Marmoricola sp.]